MLSRAFAADKDRHAVAANARDDDRFRAFGRRLGTDSSRVDTRRRGDGHRARVRARGRETGRAPGTTGGREWIFRMFSVNSLSNFKRVFARNALETPKVGGAVFVEERSVERDEEVTWEVPPMDEYERLAKNWDKEHVHKWRMLPKPGGAVCRPDDWYALHAAKQQAEKGDVQGEKPMWASHGGIAYDDRERWEFWNKLKGLSSSEAKRKFLEAYGKAMLPERESLNFRKY